MSEESCIAMCLVEPRDNGLYVVALFEYLRNIQNAFLEDARAHSPQTVRVQACKVRYSHLMSIKLELQKLSFLKQSYVHAGRRHCALQ